MTQTCFYFSGKAFHTLHSIIYAVEVPTYYSVNTTDEFLFFSIAEKWHQLLLWVSSEEAAKVGACFLSLPGSIQLSHQNKTGTRPATSKR